MANTVGKISGQVLEDNLIRQGENLAFETDLIFLDVTNKRVGINTDTPFRPLVIAGTLRTTHLIVDNQLTVPDFALSGNTITNLDGDIFLGATGPGASIFSTGIQTDGIYFDGSTISSLRSNEDIDLHPSGAGNLHFYNEVNVNGNLHVTGNVTFDGSITFGTNDTDSVTFNSDIGSDIIPDTTNTYNLGNTLKRWKDLYTSDVNGQNYVVTGSTIADNIDLALRPGNIWYVAANGNNSNVGDHANGPFATIEWALSQASSGDTVYIYPGTYVEQFPLVVPQGVTVTGTGIRDVKIVPDTSSQYEDVFKLNGETTVENLTVADFYYDSGLDKGYAFSFAPGFTLTSRSPYIRNVSVITRGSTSTVIDGEYSDAIASVLLDGGTAATASFSQIVNGGAALFLMSTDSLGFDAGDAGRGALVDGSVVSIGSNEASMLFHSVTFITPGVDAIVMKNGVRVEWLNGFIYYANRGLYAENGTLGFASQGTKFGAEIRSIGSANVYGNYGAWANGASTLMYLIGHNFAYIGTGKDTSNDHTLVIEANQITELNSGKIYYQSIDQQGNFKVGDVFKIDSATGSIVFQSVVTTNSSITVTNGTDTSYIDAFEVTTGNISIHDNTIESNSGALNFAANNNSIAIESSFEINQNLSATTFTANGNSVIGNTSTDNLAINAKLTTSLVPTNTNIELGDAIVPFKELYASQLILDNIAIDTNVVKTTLSNSDLELSANGTGVVKIADTLLVGQNLTISGNTNLLNSVVQTTLSSSGAVIATTLTSSEFATDDILIKNNFITTTLSNSNLEFRANNLGSVIIENTLKVNNSTISNVLLTGTESEKSIIFNPQAGKTVEIISDKAVILPKGNNTNRVLSSVGEIRFNNSTGLFEGQVAGGTRSLYGLYDVDTNTSLTAELTPGANDNIIRMTVNGTTRSTITEQRTTFDALRVDDLEFNNNTIRTFNSNADILLDTSGIGILNVKNNFMIDTGSITNTISNAATLIQSSGIGHVIFAGTKAVRIPSGTDAQQVTGLPVGATRWNTDQDVLEVYNGTQWQTAAGSGAATSSDDMETISEEWAIIFG